MVIIMKERASESQVQAVIAQLMDMGYDVHRSTGANR
ncbi:MAG: 3-deoxy-7-phosphoheptulonate synthase, partial [Acidobacteria bacterium]